MSILVLQLYDRCFILTLKVLYELEFIRDKSIVTKQFIMNCLHFSSQVNTPAQCGQLRNSTMFVCKVNSQYSYNMNHQ